MSSGNVSLIMVTGAEGQVGYELLRSLQGLGRVIGLNRQECDLCDLDGLRNTVRTLRPALIVNAAAYTNVDGAEAEPVLAHRINGEAPGVLAEEARRLGAALIHYSTDYVFDGTQAAPYTEEDAPCPINQYGRSKLAGERAVAEAEGAHLILRTSWVYGRRRKNFLTAVMLRIAEANTLRMATDQIGAPTWCRTVAEMTAHLVARGSRDGALVADWWRRNAGLYHLSAKGSASRYDFAREAAALVDHRPAPAIEHAVMSDFPGLAMRPANCRLATRKFARQFQLTPPPWEEALSLCLRD